MAKKRGHRNNGSNGGAPVSLREEATGIKPNATKGGAPNNPKSLLKLQHLQNLAVWAAGDGSVPSLGAFFGRRLAAVGESLGVPPDVSLFSCQRCETILQPGSNCTVRVEKNRTKARHKRKKPSTPARNNVVYTCHFCSHRNLKRGTPEGHMKDVCPPKRKAYPKAKPVKSTVVPYNSGAGIQAVHETNKVSSSLVKGESRSRIMPCNTGADILAVDKISEIGSPLVKGEAESRTPCNSGADIPAVDKISEMGTPSAKGEAEGAVTPLTKLLDSKRRKRNRKKPAEPQIADVEASASATLSKRKRKSWTSLKEIVESDEHNRNTTPLKIPFLL